jgi:glycosyltransferase involved in cell wall biosynthesis
LSKKLKSYKLDVFFSPTHYLPLLTSSPSVIAILDVSYLYFPELFKKKDLYQLKLWGGYSIRKAKKIITISNSSKNDIIKMYGKKAEDVVVAYPGIKMEEVSSKSQDISKFGIEGEFILFVGTLQPRKNLVRLIEAFSKINRKDLRLVVIGKKGWNFEEILAAPKKFSIEGKVLFLDYVSDEELPSFYKNALCFVLPSLYEGFGLPVLEAMKYGCPVLTSNISSLPEAGGNAAIYFNPEDVSDIAEKIDKVISDSKLRDEMVKKGYNQIKKFSWEKTARETLKVLEDLAK